MKFVKCLFACLFLVSLVTFSVGCGVSEEDAALNDPLAAEGDNEPEDDATGDEMLDEDPASEGDTP